MASGSDKRQRDKVLRIRCLQEEFKAIAAKANKAGFSTGAFVRAALLGDAGPRARRRPVIDKQHLIRALGLHGKYGNNMNQIARSGNAGNPLDLAALHQALKEWGEIRDALYRALGKDPDAEP